MLGVQVCSECSMEAGPIDFRSQKVCFNLSYGRSLSLPITKPISPLDFKSQYLTLNFEVYWGPQKKPTHNNEILPQSEWHELATHTEQRPLWVEDY